MTENRQLAHVAWIAKGKFNTVREHHGKDSEKNCLVFYCFISMNVIIAKSVLLPLGQVPEGNVVTLSFRIFDFEADTLCRYDFLDVYNGHSNMVQKLGRFCGTFRPGTLISTSNTMMLHMESDSETGGRGFLAHFTGTKPHLNGIHHLHQFKKWFKNKYSKIFFP